MKIPQQAQQLPVTSHKLNSLSVGGGIGQPDPKAVTPQMTLADDVVTLSVGGGIGQPDPKVSTQSVGGGIGQPDPRFNQEDGPSANISVSV